MASFLLTFCLLFLHLTNPIDGRSRKSSLNSIAQKLYDADKNNVRGLIEINLQGHTNKCGRPDKAPKKLFSKIDKAIWSKPTFKALIAMMDNYDPDVRVNEKVTPQDLNEDSTFLDLVMATDVMTELYKFLQKEKIVKSKAELSSIVKNKWFSLYDRDGDGSIVTEGSSGFEHVFMGELKKRRVIGFHNWVRFAIEESKGNLNYYGYINHKEFKNGSGILGGVYEWDGDMKCHGSMFVGTSPEFELAIYTLCYLKYPNKRCKLSIDGVSFKIQSHKLYFEGSSYIGSAYPMIFG